MKRTRSRSPRQSSSPGRRRHFTAVADEPTTVDIQPTPVPPHAEPDRRNCIHRAYRGLPCQRPCVSNEEGYCNVEHGPGAPEAVKAADVCVLANDCYQNACRKNWKILEPFVSIQQLLSLQLANWKEWRLDSLIKNVIRQMALANDDTLALLLSLLIEAAGTEYTCALRRTYYLQDCIAVTGMDFGHRTAIELSARLAMFYREVAVYIIQNHQQRGNITVQEMDRRIATGGQPQRKPELEARCQAFYRKLYSELLPWMHNLQALYSHNYIVMIDLFRERFPTRIPEEFVTGDFGDRRFVVAERLQLRLVLRFKKQNQYHVVAGIWLLMTEYLQDSLTEGDSFVAQYYATFLVVGLLEVWFIQLYHEMATDQAVIDDRIREWRRVPQVWIEHMRTRIPTVAEGIQYLLMALDSFAGYADLGPNHRPLIVLGNTTLQYLWSFRSLLQIVQTPEPRTRSLITPFRPEYSESRNTVMVPALNLNRLFQVSRHGLIAPHLAYWKNAHNNGSLLQWHQEDQQGVGRSHTTPTQYLLLRFEHQCLTVNHPNLPVLQEMLEERVDEFRKATVLKVQHHFSTNAQYQSFSDPERQELANRLWVNFLFHIVVRDSEAAGTKTLSIHGLMQDQVPRSFTLIGRQDIPVLLGKDREPHDNTSRWDNEIRDHAIWSSQSRAMRERLQTTLKQYTAELIAALHKTSLHVVHPVQFWKRLTNALIRDLIQTNAESQQYSDLKRLDQALLLYQIVSPPAAMDAMDTIRIVSVTTANNENVAVLACVLPAELLSTREAVHLDSRNLDPTDRKYYGLAIQANQSLINRPVLMVARGFSLTFTEPVELPVNPKRAFQVTPTSRH